MMGCLSVDCVFVCVSFVVVGHYFCGRWGFIVVFCLTRFRWFVVDGRLVFR
jgi:hypothetical protein